MTMENQPFEEASTIKIGGFFNCHVSFGGRKLSFAPTFFGADEVLRLGVKGNQSIVSGQYLPHTIHVWYTYIWLIFSGKCR